MGFHVRTLSVSRRTATKQRLIELIHALPDTEIVAAERFLEYLRDRGSDPLLRALDAAPPDDEPLTDEGMRAIREADEAIARGEESPWDDVRRRILGAESRPGA
jgi:hypothetical protein